MNKTFHFSTERWFPTTKKVTITYDEKKQSFKAVYSNGFLKDKVDIFKKTGRGERIVSLFSAVYVFFTGKHLSYSLISRSGNETLYRVEVEEPNSIV
jgi:hypothetical protein